MEKAELLRGEKLLFECKQKISVCEGMQVKEGLHLLLTEKAVVICKVKKRFLAKEADYILEKRYPLADMSLVNGKPFVALGIDPCAEEGLIMLSMILKETLVNIVFSDLLEEIKEREEDEGVKSEIYLFYEKLCQLIAQSEKEISVEMCLDHSEEPCLMSEKKMFCSICGAKLDEGAVFCSECGQRL